MKTAILSLGRNSLIYGIGSVVIKFVNLVTLPLFTIYLTPSDYGVLAMLAMLSMVIEPIGSLGLSAAMGPKYFESECRTNKSRVVWSTFTITIITASAVITLAWLYPELLAKLVMLDPKYSDLVSLSLTSCGITIVTTSLISQVQFEKKVYVFVTFTLIAAISAIATSVYLVIFQKMGVIGMVYGQLVSNSLSLILFFVFALRYSRFALSLDLIFALLKKGVPLVPSFAFIFVLMHSNKYFLEFYHGLNAVGIYSVGYSLGMTVSLVTSGFVTAWYPFYMSYMTKQEEAKPVFKKIFSYYTILLGTLVLVYFILATPVVTTITHENFHEAQIVVGFVAMTLYLGGIYSLMVPAIYFKEEISVQSLIQGIAVIIFLPISAVIIKYLGILGAAISISLGHFVMAVLTHFWNRYRGSDYLQIDYDWKILKIFFVYFAVIVLIFEFINFDNFFNNLIFSVIGIVITIYAMLAILKKSDLPLFPLSNWIDS